MTSHKVVWNGERGYLVAQLFELDLPVEGEKMPTELEVLEFRAGDALDQLNEHLAEMRENDDRETRDELDE